MSLSDYRLLYGELQTNTGGTQVSHRLRGELPLITASATDTLNAAGRMSATCVLTTDVFPTPATLAPANTTIYLERNGSIVWGGILWGAQGDIDAMTIQLDCEGFYGYFKNKIHILNQSYKDIFGTIDLFDHIRDHTNLGSLTQTSPGQYNIGITLDTDDKGVAFPLNEGYTSDNRQSWGDYLEYLSATYGFDWRYVAYREPTDSYKIHVLFDLMQPGGLNTDIVFEVGVNCSKLTYREDGTTVTNLVNVVGSGGMSGQGSNPSSYGVAYPALETLIDDSSLNSSAAFTAAITNALIRGQKPMQHVTLSTFPDTNPAIGTYYVGNKVRVRSHVGWVEIDNTQFRIVESTLNVSEASEEIQLTLAGIDNFTNPGNFSIALNF